ncbi:type II 3-dehydroquinate dehydratase [Sporosalibacterium faouarense]|uniref:type II 3-dehydroquinate dehydratase n=1 Tax=Sporosalibacterium faouarense TaxID=516123 RepID=UPI00141CDA85|nr:type II 3-dehydroquinate dehydratase [Sporosalibacterium faouarense]MTI47375.1 type II 3-dehydroquinate dehydratase [Bacillota bacterium]
MKLLILNGPNINMLGKRERAIYGESSYEDLCEYIRVNGQNLSINVDILQSNIEGELVTYIQDAYDKYDGIIINPAAYTHYSIAIYDALKAVDIPTVEVHISNIYAREEYRRKSVVAPACIGQISGFGIYSYVMGMMALINKAK